MTVPMGRFSFLNHKDTIAFLRLMFVELRKLTQRDGFYGVNRALDKALEELKAVKEVPPEVVTPKPE